jgi:predicted nucleotide-binding protein
VRDFDGLFSFLAESSYATLSSRMAKKQTCEREPPGRPSVSPEVGIQLLRKQIEKGKGLLEAKPLDRTIYKNWEHATGEFVVKAFGERTLSAMEYFRIGLTHAGRDPEQEALDDLTQQLATLDGLVDLLGTEIEIRATQVPPAVAKTATPSLSLFVFVVHGRDGGTKETVARFISKLGLTPVILHEQPNMGRTIIEKFTDHADVGFAVVLMTGDDKGGLASVPANEFKLRARQNVILELGFFLGKLGRSRVCALYAPDVEIPSDYDGVVFVRLDTEGAWRLLLVRELRAAGLPVDMNAAL